MAFFKAVWAIPDENPPVLWPGNVLANLDSWELFPAEYSAQTKTWTISEEISVVDAETTLTVVASNDGFIVSTMKPKPQVMPFYVKGFQLPKEFWPLIVGKKATVDWYQASQNKKLKVAYLGNYILGYASNKCFPKGKPYIMLGVTQLLKWSNPFDLNCPEIEGVVSADGSPFMVIQLKEVPISFDFGEMSEEEFLEVLNPKIKEEDKKNAENPFGG